MLDIRRAVPAEAGEVLTVQRAAWVTEGQLHDTLDIAPLTETLDEVRAAIAAGAVLVAREGSRLVGTVRGELNDGAWHVGRLGVVPDLQGRGVGSRLLRAIEDAAPGDVEQFTLFTGVNSVRNVALYERNGYQTAPSEDGLVHMVKKRAQP